MDVEIEWRTSIPEGVGLGGSSAIAIAVTRALCALRGVNLEPDAMAAFALAVEREDLGIAGGRQDQIVEAHGGLVFIDFAADPAGRCERLDAALLPPLLVAWRKDWAKNSGIVHAELRARYEADDGDVRGAMRELASIAAQARAALLAGDREGFGRCVDRTYELRASIMTLDPRDVAMVRCAQAAGAPANYTGSGGAIVAVCRDERHRLLVGERLASLPATGLISVARAG
jgi:glucuronokinase